MEGNPLAIETGDRTLDPAQAPSSNTGTLRQILSWFANRIKAIMGTTNWWDAPPVTLSGATPNTRKITAGNGLAGGGDLSADRTIALRVLAVSDTVMHSALTERSHDGQDEKIVKRFRVNGLGTIRLTFELRSSASAAPAYAKVYGNAVERALAKSSSLSYEPFSLDVDVFGTTLIEVAIYRGSISTTVYIRNVRVRYDVAEVGDEGVLLD